jgi:hypothetical protein
MVVARPLLGGRGVSGFLGVGLRGGFAPGGHDDVTVSGPDA